MTVGRPTKYKKEYNDQVVKLCKLGATDREIADFFDVAESTLNNWKIKEPEFMESIKRGKIEADMNVADSLYKRAMGYEHAEDKIFNNNGEPMIVKTIKHYAPDTTAIMAWLNNRRPDQFRSKQYVEAVNTNLNAEMTEEEAKEIIENAKKKGLL